MKNIYEKKTEVMKYERLIYSEMILLNPTILASVILNSAKGNVIIKFYYTKKHETHNVQITLEEIRSIFFPFVSDLISINEKELGQRILYHYKDLIIKNSSILKLFKYNNVN